VDEGLDHCYRCGYRFCEECRVDFQGHPHCATCKSEAVSMLESGASAGGDGGGPAGARGELPPWERRQELGMMAAFVETMKQVISSHTRFFANMRLGVTTWDCLAIPCIVGVVAMVVSTAFNMVFFGAFTGFAASQSGGGAGEAGAAVAGQLLTGVCMIPLAPVFAIAGSFFAAGMIHVFLMMTGNVRQPFQQTLRGYCYAQSPGILAIVPILGSIVGGIMSLWASVVMVKTVHKTSWGMAWMSVLWFLILILVLACGVGILFAGVIGASAAGSGNF